MDLSVIILNYNTREHLRTCLQSVLAEGSSLATEVIVVDNASSDGSADMVAAEFPTVVLIRSPRNGGFAHGNNQGLRVCTGAAVMLLNPDTRVPPGAFAALVSKLRRDARVGIVGPKLLRPDGSMHLASRRGFPTPSVAFYRLVGLSRLFPRSKRFGRYNLTYLDPDRATDVDSVCGACMVLRREVIDQIGLLDERFFMYGEDIDWCLRAGEAGWRVRYEPSIVVQHQHGAASRGRPLRSTFHFFRAMDLFYQKHYVERYHPLVTGAVRTAIYGALTLAVCRSFLTPPARRRVGF